MVDDQNKIEQELLEEAYIKWEQEFITGGKMILIEIVVLTSFVYAIDYLFLSPLDPEVS